MKNCQSCGMPMTKPEEFGGNNPNNDWCMHCCNSDGSHKSKEEVREGMAQFMLTDEGKKMIEQMGQDPCNTIEEAEKAADVYMAQMPAWKE